MIRRTIWFLVAAGLALGGCSKVNAENYQKLKPGMPFEEVTGLLGAPDSCSEKIGLKSCLWGDSSSHIRVNFVAGKVALYSAENLR